MPNSKDNKIIGSKPPVHAPGAAPVEEYWTEERRAAAKPVQSPKPPEGKGAPSEEGKQPHGETGHTLGEHGHEKAPATHSEPRGTGGQAVPNPLVYPYRTVGKLFFTQGGSGWAGSAALIAPNILLTAGHCVFANGGWSSNVAFFPSYPKRTASDPSYKYNYSYLACWTAWSQNGNRAYDYGMVWIDAAPGSHLGWLGTLWNAPANLTCEAIGYPATPNPPFNGNTMDHCVGQTVSSSTAGVVGLNNDNMEHGSSGGPWITAWQEPTRTHAAGLQSFHIHDGDTTEYGPYFTGDLNALMNWISNPANRK